VIRFGRHPLALACASARLAVEPKPWSIRRVLRRLDPDFRLHFASTDADYGTLASFQAVYAILAPGDQWIFARPGLIPTVVVEPWLVAAIDGTDEETARGPISRLADAGLLERAGSDGTTWQLHELVAMFARYLATAIPPDEGNAVVDRVIAATLARVRSLKEFLDSPISDADPQRKRQLQELELSRQAAEAAAMVDLGVRLSLEIVRGLATILLEIITERPGLTSAHRVARSIAVVARTTGDPHLRLGVDLWQKANRDGSRPAPPGQGLDDRDQKSGRSNRPGGGPGPGGGGGGGGPGPGGGGGGGGGGPGSSGGGGGWSRGAGPRPGDPVREGHALRDQGAAASRAGESRTARLFLHASRRIAERYEDGPGLAAASLELGLTESVGGRLGPAERFLTRAAELSEALGDHGGQARALLELGRVARALGRPEQAAESLEAARRAYKLARDDAGQAAALFALGLLAAGQPEHAAFLFQESLRLAEASGDRNAQAGASFELSRIAWDRGDPGEAATWLSGP
jgi:tetratricopeptide (TPR) repeat protein